MEIFLQQVINGISLGATYAVFAIGFTLVFGVLNILDLSQGAVYMWGAFTGLVCTAWFHLPLIVALPTAMALAGAIAVATELGVFAPLRERGAHRWMGLVASLAVARILVAVAQEVFGTQVLRYPFETVPNVTWGAGGVTIRLLQVVVVLIAVALMLGARLFLHRTKAGRGIRAVAFSERVAGLVGVPVRRMTILTFFVSGALAGSAGVLLGLLFNAVSPFMGDAILLRGLTVMILGGLGNVEGAMVGGFLLGLIEVFSVAYVSSAFRDAIGFALVFLILLLKPSGLFGAPMERRA